MKLFLKLGKVFVITIICGLCVVKSSAGISQFSANRDIKMEIVNSKDAFIAVPDVINLELTTLKETTNYYDLILLDEDEDKAISSKDVIKIDDILYKKGLVKTEETIEIKNITHNLTIVNNMSKDLELVSVTLGTPMLQINYDQFPIKPGEEKVFTITKNPSYIDSDIINNISSTSEATLDFKWNGGQSTIYVNVDISFLEKENIINKDLYELK